MVIMIIVEDLLLLLRFQAFIDAIHFKEPVAVGTVQSLLRNPETPIAAGFARAIHARVSAVAQEILHGDNGQSL